MNMKIRLILTALSSLLVAGAAPATTDPTATNPPNIIGLESISFAENSPHPVATYTARHAQGNPIIWSLAGRDAEAFTFATDEPYLNASKRAVKAPARPEPPTVVVYAGALSAMETSGRLHVSVGYEVLIGDGDGA